MEQEATHCPTCGVRFNARGTIAITSENQHLVDHPSQFSSSLSALGESTLEKGGLEEPSTAVTVQSSMDTDWSPGGPV